MAFVNGDAVVTPDALGHLVAVAADPSVALASASLRLYDRPEVMNSAGNPVHYAGLSWAGGARRARRPARRAARHRQRDRGRRRRTTRAVRCDGRLLRADVRLLRGRGAQSSLLAARAALPRTCPDAAVLHRYEFGRNPSKMYLLERNRLLLLLTLYERRTLLMLTPALLGLELAMVAVALRQGWARQKAAGWWWLLRHTAEVRQRRRVVQAARTRGDAQVVGLLTGDFGPATRRGSRLRPSCAGARAPTGGRCAGCYAPLR